MSFAAVQKHVAVLERAGLVAKERRGREQLVHTDTEAVRRARQALDELEAAWRGRVERMTEVLANLNMPSREEVLSLSTRLTHIEMAIDDLGAGLEQLRRSVGGARPQRTSTRERDGGSETRTVSAQEV